MVEGKNRKQPLKATMGRKKNNQRNNRGDDSDEEFVDPVEAARRAELAQKEQAKTTGPKKMTKAQLRKLKQQQEYVLLVFLLLLLVVSCKNLESFSFADCVCCRAFAQLLFCLSLLRPVPFFYSREAQKANEVSAIAAAVAPAYFQCLWTFLMKCRVFVLLIGVRGQL